MEIAALGLQHNGTAPVPHGLFLHEIHHSRGDALTVQFIRHPHFGDQKTVAPLLRTALDAGEKFLLRRGFLTACRAGALASLGRFFSDDPPCFGIGPVVRIKPVLEIRLMQYRFIE